MIRTHCLTLATVAVAWALPVFSARGENITKVILINGQQTGNITTPATGCGVVDIDTDSNTLTYHIVYSDLVGDEVAAHFHGPASIGESAGAIHLLPMGSPKVGSWNYPESREEDILAGRLYLNIHTSTSLGGEIRGQVVDMVAVLDSAQAGVGGAAAGYALFCIDVCADELTYHVSYDPFSFNPADETSAAIHGFSLHETAAPILLSLPLGLAKNGTWNYPPEEEEQLLNGLASVTIASREFPGGVMRGQITRGVVPLDGDQAVPTVASGGHGCGLFALDTTTDIMSIHVHTRQLSGSVTAVELRGPALQGSNGDLLLDLGPTTPAIASLPYAGTSESTLLNGLSYLVVATTGNATGEVRGQLQLPEPPCPADTNGDGTVNVDDLVAVILLWGQADGCVDINGSGSVNVDDLVSVILAWGPCSTL